MLHRSADTLACILHGAQRLTEPQRSKVNSLLASYSQRLAQLENIAAVEAAQGTRQMTAKSLEAPAAARRVAAQVVPLRSLNLERPQLPRIWRRSVQKPWVGLQGDDPEAARALGIPSPRSAQAPVLPPTDFRLLPFWMVSRILCAIQSGAFLLPGVFVPASVFRTPLQSFDSLGSRVRSVAAARQALEAAAASMSLHDVPTYDLFCRTLEGLAVSLEDAAECPPCTPTSPSQHSMPAADKPQPQPQPQPQLQDAAPTPESAFGGATAQGVHGPASPAAAQTRSQNQGTLPPSPPSALHGAVVSGNTHGTVASAATLPTPGQLAPAAPCTPILGCTPVAFLDSVPVHCASVGAGALPAAAAEAGTRRALNPGRMCPSALHLPVQLEQYADEHKPTQVMPAAQQGQGQVQPRAAGGNEQPGAPIAPSAPTAQNVPSATAGSSLWSFVAPALSSVFGAAEAAAASPRDLAAGIFQTPQQPATPGPNERTAATKASMQAYWHEVAGLCCAMQPLGAWCALLVASEAGSGKMRPSCAVPPHTSATKSVQSMNCSAAGGIPETGAAPLLAAAAASHALSNLPFLASLFPLEDPGHTTAVLEALFGPLRGCSGSSPPEASSGRPRSPAEAAGSASGPRLGQRGGNSCPPHTHLLHYTAQANAMLFCVRCPCCWSGVRMRCGVSCLVWCFQMSWLACSKAWPQQRTVQSKSPRQVQIIVFL